MFSGNQKSRIGAGACARSGRDEHVADSPGWGDLMARVDASFPHLVRQKLGPLLTEHGFVALAEDAHQVVLESPALRVVAVLDPRGEVEVRVSLKETPDWQGWSYSGMVGRAPVERLLELALQQLQEEPRVLSGDVAFFERLAAERQAESEAWTAYYGGTGPRPGRRDLP
jgi:hypothetical protein